VRGCGKAMRTRLPLGAAHNDGIAPTPRLERSAGRGADLPEPLSSLDIVGHDAILLVHRTSLKLPDGAMNRLLFRAADFLSRPPGFYIVLVAMVACTALVPLGLTDVVTYALSVLAIVITGIVLIQGYRDTAAIHAKLDEIIVALRETRNDVVGLEHADPKEIKAVVERLEQEAEELADAAERPTTLGAVESSQL
jgi:low affinity Fe/Cu permease